MEVLEIMKRTVIGKTLPGLPISPVVRVGDLLFVCGQVGTDATGAVAGKDIESQTRQALLNLRAALEEAGSDLTRVDSVTVYLVNQKDFAGMNRVYKEFFTADYPVRTTVIVAALVDPANIIEISAIAHV